MLTGAAIWYDTFKNCTSLSELVINSESEVRLGKAIEGCERLETILITSGVELVCDGFTRTGPVNDGKYDLWEKSETE